MAAVMNWVVQRSIKRCSNRHDLAEFPGSAHDNRIWKATKLEKNQPHTSLAWKMSWENLRLRIAERGISLQETKRRIDCEDEEMFNEELAKLRIVTEHTECSKNLED
jgi:hypothetical protein